MYSDIRKINKDFGVRVSETIDLGHMYNKMTGTPKRNWGLNNLLMLKVYSFIYDAKMMLKPSVHLNKIDNREIIIAKLCRRRQVLWTTCFAIMCPL